MVVFVYASEQKPSIERLRRIKNQHLFSYFYRQAKKKLVTASALAPPHIENDNLTYSNALTFMRALGYPSIYGNTDIFSDEK